MNPQSGGAGTPTIGSSKAPVLVISLLVILLIGAISFGVWAFSGRQSYKNNASQNIAAAVAAAKTAEASLQQQNFATQLKQPYASFTSSITDGSISFSYPKTYSAYVDQTSSSEPLNGYFYPGQVPGVSSNTAFALRIELDSDSYSDVLNQVSSSAQNGNVSVAAYVPPKMVGVKNVQTGSMITGVVGQDSQSNPYTGAMLVIPVRDKTLKLYTESPNFLSDFNSIILPSLTFVP
jgi:hypothetical protein